MQDKARGEGKYVGRPEKRNAKIAAMLKAGQRYSDVQDAIGCSRATVANFAKRLKPAAGNDLDESLVV